MTYFLSPRQFLSHPANMTSHAGEEVTLVCSTMGGAGAGCHWTVGKSPVELTSTRHSVLQEVQVRGTNIHCCATLHRYST